MLNFYPARRVARPARKPNVRGISAAAIVAATGATPPQMRAVLRAMYAAHCNGTLPMAANW